MYYALQKQTEVIVFFSSEVSGVCQICIAVLFLILKAG